MTETLSQLTADIAAFVRTPEVGDFDHLVERAAGFQHEGASPEGHLYRQIATATWRRFCLDRLTPSPVLSLVTPGDEGSNRHLGGELDQIILSAWAADDSLAAIGPRGLDTRTTRGFLAARQRDNRPVLLVATRSTLSDLIRSLERLDLRFRLAAGSVAVVGVDGPADPKPDSALDLSTLIERTEEYLGLTAERFVRRLDPTPRTRMFTDTLSGGSPVHFVAPHWVRLEIVDPESGQTAAAGESGRLRLLDLANLGGPIAVDTEISGTLDPQGFRLPELRP